MCLAEFDVSFYDPCKLQFYITKDVTSFLWVRSNIVIDQHSNTESGNSITQPQTDRSNNSQSTLSYNTSHCE